MDVYSNIMTITKDASLSEELTQEAFYRAMKSEFQGKSSELTWLCAIAKNLCTDEFRKRKKEAVYDEEAIDTADNPNRTNMEQYVMSTLAIIMVTIVLIMMQSTEIYAAEQIFPSGVESIQLEEKIDAYVEEHRNTTTGMAVSVFDSADELLKKYYGYADVENQIAVTQDSVFEWSSTTKLLVWVSVMQLYKQVKIELDADICSYFPEGFLTKLSYDTPVTMLNLMNHNAGFQEGYVDLMVTDADCISSLGEALRKHEPAQIYEPGTVTAYSNRGVALAGFIVEQVRGKSFGKYVHENIFEPLQMEHSTIFMDLSDNEWVQQKRKELQCYTTEGDLIPNCFYLRLL
ncbi:MAG: serine hydrolase [Lachnospiraceae bacterium]|nr:serine hydrolase [Lachnospiraceae bacterium]